MTHPTFQTDRLSVRPIRSADRDAVIRLFADPETSRYLGSGLDDPVKSGAVFERWHGELSPSGLGVWLFDLDGEIIGAARLAPANRPPVGMPEAGWVLARTHEGQGFAAEGVRAVLDHGMTTLGLPAIWAMIDPANAASVRLAAKLGFLDVTNHNDPTEPVDRVHVLLPATRPVEVSQATLRTERLVVRPLQHTDRQAMREIFSDPLVVRYRGGGGDPEWTEKVIDHRLGYSGPAGTGHWAFVEDGTVVGVGHLRPSRELPDGVPSMGWYLASAHHGRGLATEAATALLAYGLNTLRMPAVWALIRKENSPSTRLAERLGFVNVGNGQHYGAAHQVYVALPGSATA